jgi:hypothetical protein
MSSWPIAELRPRAVCFGFRRILMTKWKLAMGAAAISLSSMAIAGPGGGHGGGGDHGGGDVGGGPKSGGGGGPHGGAENHGGGGPHGDGGGHEFHGGGHGSGGGQAFNGGGRGNGHSGGHVMRSAHLVSQQMHGSGRHAERHAMRHEHLARPAERFARAQQRPNFVRDHGRSLAFAAAGAGAGYAGVRYSERLGQRGPIDGCPPGLAAKNNGCLPPGQVKQRWGYGAPLDARFADSYLPGLYRSWYPDTDQYSYRYGDGYAYRVDRSNNFVSGLFPLSGMDYYAPGEQYPSAYDFYNVPQLYQSYYPNNGPYDYRYGDGAIYQVNRSNGLVDSIVALLSGGLGGGGIGSGPGGGLGGLGGGLGALGGLGIGQPLPTGYDVYNVPDQYRDRYYDTANKNYRYADGNIYRVDPKTQVIQAIISALV